MDFVKLAEERYSVRKFSPQAVEAEKLEVILQAGRNAPTACNNQPQRILVINDPAGMEKLQSCTSYTFGAPLALLVCFDRTKSWVRPFDRDNSGVVDASIVTTQMMLQAADLGLGTTWVGHFDPARVVAEFKLPASFVPVAVLPLGYPAADAVKNPLHFKKLPAAEVVFYASFSRGN
ncbi:MAG: nitroreductase family protein [Planctomycetota bacterium]|jgi:nitroreductase|nr:nitroreductase family protein [Planctomycetota bacterium]